MKKLAKNFGRSLTASALTSICVPAFAAPVSFNIAPQPLRSALLEFGVQSGQQLSYRDSPAFKRTTRAVTGNQEPDDALRQLLDGSGLQARRRGNMLLISMAQAAPAAMIAASGEAPAAPPPEPEAATSPNGLEDIVVTATRREEKLQRVPIAVTALSSEAVQVRQLNDVNSLQRSAPSLYVAPFGDSSTAIISLRGQVATDNVVTIDPAVGVYLDGVYIARATGGNLNFVDVDRVEVLRGPQGTLFGRNTIGGALSVTTSQPTDRFEGSVRGSYGNYDARKLTGVLNLPVTERVALRVVGQHSQRDGFARSNITGNDLNDENAEYVRATLRADLGPDWTLSLAGDYSDSRYSGQWITLTKVLPAADANALRISGGTNNISQYINPFGTSVPVNTRGPFLSRSWGGSATLAGNLGDVNVKSITSYRHMHRDLNNFDQDGSPFVFAELARNATFQHQISQELQAYGKLFDGRLDYIVGAYYFKERGHDLIFSRFLFPLSPNYSVTDGVARNDSVAFYGQFTYSLTDRLSLLAGVRYTRDGRDLTLNNRTASTLPSGAPGTTIACNTAGASLPGCERQVDKVHFSYVPFTAGLNFQATPDALFYAKMSRGYRSGGFNLRAAASLQLTPFSPERLDTFEIGAKIDIANVLRINAAAYHSLFNNIQFNASLNAGNNVSTTIVANAGKARITGVEVEATAALGRLNLSANIGLIDARYTKLLPNVVGVTLGSDFQVTPEITYGLAADYVLPLPVGSLTLHGDYSWRDRTAYALIPPSDPGNYAPAFGLINAVATLRLDGGLEFGIWGRNLANKRYFTRVQNLAPAVSVLSAFPGDPRTYGLTAGYKF